MKADGVALATVIANGVSAIALLAALTREKGELRLRLSRLRVSLPQLKKMLRIGVPAGLQSSIFAFSSIIIQFAINSLGETVMAGSSAGFSIEVLSFHIASAFAQACTTFVGQNAGAGQFDRCREVFKVSLIEGMAATLSLISFLILFGREIPLAFEGMNMNYSRFVCIYWKILGKSG